MKKQNNQKKFITYFLISYLMSMFFPVFIFSSEIKEFEVKGIVNGNTIILEDGRTIKLIGINAFDPSDRKNLSDSSREFGIIEEDLIHIGNKAKELLEKLVLGKKVEVESDIINTDALNKEGTSGVSLAYIYMQLKKPPVEILNALNPENKKKFKWKKRRVNINALMIQSGFCASLKKLHYKFKDEFINFEKTAKSLNIGLWKWANTATPSNPAETVESPANLNNNVLFVMYKNNGDKIHEITCADMQYASIKDLNVFNKLEEAPQNIEKCKKCIPEK